VRHSGWTGAGVCGVTVLGLLLAGCAQTPLGPTVQVMPGPGKSFDAFQYDQMACKQFAEQSVAGQAQDANNRAVGAAALTTVLGAGLGAAVGGGRGAAIGAASGAVGGTAIGAGMSSNQQYGIQQQYDNAFAQCMYAKGEMVPGYGPMMVQSPSPPPYGYDMDLTRAVQVQLMRLGYMRGPADGISGPQTSTAISQFESISGLPVDGMPSPPLLARLQATR
jgi:putative peptidoglycan binding protein